MDMASALGAGDYFMRNDGALVHVSTFGKIVGLDLGDIENPIGVVFTLINGDVPFKYIRLNDYWFKEDENGNPMHVRMDDKYSLYEKSTRADEIENGKVYKKNNAEEFIEIIDTLVHPKTKEEFVVYANNFGRDISYRESFEYALNFMPTKNLHLEYTRVDPYKNMSTF